MNVKQLFADGGTSSTTTSVFGRFRTVLGGDRTSGVYAECRRCGRTVEHEARDCPQCGTDAIARYELN
jgi:uncharacterized OB-fold protein